MAKQSMPDKAGPPVGPPIGSPQAPLPPWRYIVWALVLLTFSWFWFGANQVAQRQDLAYSEFKDRVRQEEVASVVFKGQTVFGEFRGTISREPAAQTTTLPKMFITTLPPVDDPDLMPLLEKHLVEVRAETQQTSL